jgi:hypothetical protein
VNSRGVIRGDNTGVDGERSRLAVNGQIAVEMHVSDAEPMSAEIDNPATGDSSHRTRCPALSTLAVHQPFSQTG